VLVAEDEPAVRELILQVVADAGCTGLAAANGVEALRVAEAHDREIDLLVTDMIMPGMDGSQLAGQLSAQRPGIKTLFISGFAEDGIVSSGKLKRGVTLMQKPFTMSALAGKVREMLQSS
jgi:CheY-like chemotaxis protein